MNWKLMKAVALAAGAVLLVGACSGSGGEAEDDGVLRIAMGSPGEAQIRVWDDVAAQFMAANPETKSEINYQDDDLYQTIGLQNLLAGRNAPDIYFEWTGARLAQRQADGYVADITKAFKSGPLAGLFGGRDPRRYAVVRKAPSWSPTRPTSPTSSGTTRRSFGTPAWSRPPRGTTSSPWHRAQRQGRHPDDDGQ